MKKFFIIIKSIFFIGILTVGLTFYVRAGAKYNTMEVGFYGLSDEVIQTLIAWIDERNIDWRPIILDSTKPLDEQIKSPVSYNLLFTSDGKNMDAISPYVRTAKTDNLMVMPVPIRVSVKTGGRLTATPILADHFQLSYNVDVLRQLGATMPTNLIDLESIAQTSLLNPTRGSFSAPILCAGADDDDLIMFFSAMLETLHGYENYEIAQLVLEQTIADLKRNEEVLFDTFFELPHVYNTLQYISTWENRRLLSSSWLQLSREDVVIAMENKSPVFAFFPFTTYNNLSQGVKNTYATWYMPSGNNRETRYLVAPTVVVMEFSYVKSPLQSARQAAKKNELAASLITELVSGLSQAGLSEGSGLVPLNSTALAPNLPTAETRQIFALSDGIIPDIATAAFDSIEHKNLFARRLRSALVEVKNEN